MSSSPSSRFPNRRTNAERRKIPTRVHTTSGRDLQFLQKTAAVFFLNVPNADGTTSDGYDWSGRRIRRAEISSIKRISTNGNMKTSGKLKIVYKRVVMHFP